MSPHQALHDLVDRLNEPDAAAALVVLGQRFAQPPNGNPADDKEPDDIANPLAGFIGILDDEATSPADISMNKDQYPAASASPLDDLEPIHPDDPLAVIIGLFGDADAGPADMSTNKYRYLVESYGDLHRDDQ